MSQQNVIWMINQTASTPETGYAGRQYYLGLELAKLGYKVYVIAGSYSHLLRVPKIFEGDFLTENITPDFDFVWVNIPHYPNSHSKKRIVGEFIFSWKIKELKKYIKDKPDIILHSSPPLISYFGAKYLASYFNAKYVFEVRDIWPKTLVELGGYSLLHPFIQLLQWIEDNSYRSADIVLSNLKNSVEHMVTRGLDREKFLWIPNGYSQQEVLGKEDLPDEIQLLIPKDKFIIGYAGSIGIANCLHHLIEVANDLKKYENLCFVIVGKGAYKGVLLTKVKELQLNNVIFIDPIPKRQIQSVLELFDVCYVGLTKDPLFKFGVSPNKLFDYLYAGKPILYAIDSGTYTPVADAQAGYQVIPENTIDLAEKIEKLMSLSSNERELMGKNARKHAEEFYEYSAIAKKLANKLFN
ncbi:glycosyltransferase family 4 protein [Moraxella sp. ZY210820]|uniref:glycosyltransferase family 4 protein n=1 Tax=unclassified Moraxella TaxID=2685852 RepID=UPI002731BA75|nr:glycosyltransferase family 4 protein [Moraxella sp. ZY210820]WLF83689.1 glycosyltransferase family 4 protein [Moraxella sp. ZY210820]